MDFERSNEYHSSRTRFLAVLIIAVMAFSVLALLPEEQSDAVSKNVTVYSWDELEEELKHLEDEEVIMFGQDIELGNDDDITIEGVKNLTIDMFNHVLKRGIGGRGYEETGQIKFEGGAVVRIINGTLNGGCYDNGAGLYIKGGSSVTIENVNFSNSYASDEGGCIFIKESSTLVMKNGEISKCVAEDDGGFIRALDSSNIVLENVKFIEGTAREKGGAINAEDGTTMTITNCEFQDNFSSDDGGAICLENTGQVDIIGCTFFRNTSYGSGGALCIDETGTVNIKGCTFRYNKVHLGDDWLDGGGIFIEDSKVFIGPNGDTGCLFIKNSATTNGGAIRICGGDVEIRGAEISENYTYGSGGAIYVTDDANLLLEDCKISKNKAEDGIGGVLIGDDADVKMQGSMYVMENEKGSDTKGFLGVANVFIKGKNAIECGAFKDGTEIGIDLEKKDRVFTKGYQNSNPDKDPAAFFKAVDGYYVAQDPDSKEVRFYGGSSGDMSDNTIWIVVGIIAAIAVIGIAVYFVRSRKP